MPDFSLIRVSPSHKVIFSKVNYKEETELFNQLTSAKVDLSELFDITNQNRKIEWMTIRSILLATHSTSDDIVYDEHRKPYFKESNAHLSISHSREMVAVSINANTITGIDIQYISEKIINIDRKFLNEKELEISSKTPLELSYYWSIKEALFKVYGKKDAFLKNNIEVTDIRYSDKEGDAKGIIQCGDHYSEHQLKLSRLDNYVMAYVVNS